MYTLYMYMYACVVYMHAPCAYCSEVWVCIFGIYNIYTLYMISIMYMYEYCVCVCVCVCTHDYT